MTLTEYEEMMVDLQEKYPVEYAAYGLSSVAVAIVFPLIKSYIAVSIELLHTQTHICTRLAHSSYNQYMRTHINMVDT